VAAVVVVLAGWRVQVHVLAQGQATVLSVKDGVYSRGQSMRGASLYAEYCGSCHGSELQGGEFGADEVPSLKREDFLRSGDLGMIFERIRRLMPLNAPGILTDQTYVDVLAFLLEQNGFPSGVNELTSNLEALRLIRVAKATPVGTGTLVQIVGCLHREGDAWSVVGANEPVAVGGPAPAPADVAEARGQSRGQQTFALINVDAESATVSSRVVVRGLLILTPTRNRLNVMTLTVAAPSCP
jgi:mono/diheme cytochrome c family protein